jgi:hypothetical protein
MKIKVERKLGHNTIILEYRKTPPRPVTGVA